MRKTTALKRMRWKPARERKLLDKLPQHPQRPTNGQVPLLLEMKPPHKRLLSEKGSGRTKGNLQPREQRRQQKQQQWNLQQGRESSMVATKKRRKTLSTWKTKWKSPVLQEKGETTTPPPLTQPIKIWIIYSGASSHMYKSQDRFENRKPATGSIKGVNGKAIAITGKGRVRILTKNSTGSERTLILERVLLIPTLKHNLFSICTIAEKRYRAP